ncbi:MAG: tRNA dihydrouridine synthase DusB [Spirochaetota bacterium]|nr:MAG: tRNA dihydrouridine synthase DusB [Spirochaetota bacterium]
MGLLKKIKIGEVLTDNNVFLAPLAGVGDRSFRLLHKRFGAGLTFTEMVSAHGIVNGNQKTQDLLKLSRKERPDGIQIFGSNPEIMAGAASAIGEYPADILDINGGCSVKKVMKTGAGASLLGNPNEFYEVVKACVNVSPYPVSVKIRLGLTEDRINVIENALAAQEAGARLITLHPRTAQSKYSGTARWEYIGLVKQKLKIPVCGNGDIRTEDDAVRMILETGCDAVMIGRAAIGNPWIIRNTVRTFSDYPEKVVCARPTKHERVNLALEHLELICSLKGETKGVRDIKKHIYRYLREIPHIAEIRSSLFKIDSKGEAQQKLESLLEIFR